VSSESNVINMKRASQLIEEAREARAKRQAERQEDLIKREKDAEGK
jgi:hypothetical protein